MATYKSHIDGIITWLETIARSNVSTLAGEAPNPGARPWCWLGLPSVAFDAIKSAFTSKDQTDAYADEYNQDQLTNTSIAFTQEEGDMIYSLQKCFTMRYERRMDFYRNDCEQKDVRVFNNINHAVAKFDHMSLTAV